MVKRGSPCYVEVGSHRVSRGQPGQRSRSGNRPQYVRTDRQTVPTVGASVPTIGRHERPFDVPTFDVPMFDARTFDVQTFGAQVFGGERAFVCPGFAIVDTPQGLPPSPSPRWPRFTLPLPPYQWGTSIRGVPDRYFERGTL